MATVSTHRRAAALPAHVPYGAAAKAATAALALALGACGSSGGDDPSSPPLSDDATTVVTAPEAPTDTSLPDAVDSLPDDAPTVPTGGDTGTGDDPALVDPAPVDPVPVDPDPVNLGTDDVAEPETPAAPETPAEPAVTSTRVAFDITVPAYASDELQLDVAWGATEIRAEWVVDETWTATAELPADTEDRLLVTFHDDYGSTTLATHEAVFRTSSEASQTHTISADDFDSARWDNDGDGVGNLAELIAGTDPDFVEIAGAPNPPAELISIEYSGYDLELFWTRATDEDGAVIGYDVYRDDEQLTVLLDALSFYDGSVQPETRYTYDVYAVDDEGYRSRAATLVLTTPADEPVSGAQPNTAVLNGGGGASWSISDGLSTSTGSWNSGSCSYSQGAGSGVGIVDANLPGNWDAFDWASLMWVNGEQVGGWLRSADGTTSNYASVPIAGLQIATEYHAVSTLPVLRNYTSFGNDTPEDIFIVVNVATNFGADGGNRVMQSSSGDLAFGADDRWIVTDDYDDVGGDPANVTVFFGPDSPASNSVFTGDSVFDCYGDQGLTARIDVVVPAGESRALMLFHGLAVSSVEAQELATLFDVTPEFGNELTEGLGEEQLSAVVNWNY